MAGYCTDATGGKLEKAFNPIACAHSALSNVWQPIATKQGYCVDLWGRVVYDGDGSGTQSKSYNACIGDGHVWSGTGGVCVDKRSGLISSDMPKSNKAACM